jgi:hypothetical protein
MLRICDNTDRDASNVTTNSCRNISDIHRVNGIYLGERQGEARKPLDSSLSLFATFQ